MLVMTGLSSIPLAYIASSILGRPAEGFAILVVFYLITGIIFVVALLANSVPKMEIRWLRDVMLWTFRSSPVFSLSWGFGKVFRAGLLPKYCKQIPKARLTMICNTISVERNRQQNDSRQ